MTNAAQSLPSANNKYWSNDEAKRLKALVLADTSVDKIAKQLNRTPGGIETRIKRLRRTGDLPYQGQMVRKGADGVVPFSYQVPERTRDCADRERKMLDAVNAEGGFPLRRTIQLRGHLVAVLTTLDPHTPHPFQLAQFTKAAA